MIITGYIVSNSNNRRLIRLIAIDSLYSSLIVQLFIKLNSDDVLSFSTLTFILSLIIQMVLIIYY